MADLTSNATANIEGRNVQTIGAKIKGSNVGAIPSALSRSRKSARLAKEKARGGFMSVQSENKYSGLGPIVNEGDRWSRQIAPLYSEDSQLVNGEE